jgi:cobalt-zinc-cadmium resistance protein CzcA
MLERIITWSLRHRFLVLAGGAVFVAVGVLAMSRLEVDAFPDTTPVQIQINTVAPELSPEEVEQQLTFAVEQAIGGLPHMESVRSISKFGLSQVAVTFEDGTDIYFARQLVMERLGTVALPEGMPRPEMGPVSTGLGEVFHYVVTGAGRDLTELRTLQDWVVKPALRTVPGTAEVNSWGGFEKQYQVRVDPVRLLKHGLTLAEIVEAVRANNLNVGGGSLSVGGEMQLVQGLGRTTDAEQIRRIVVASRDGVPVRVGDLAEVAIGHEIRRGAVTADGKGEAVLGLGFMLMGENSHDVTTRLKARLEEVKKTLPAGVRAETVYDRTELVDHVIDTVRRNLFEGGLLVVAVLFVFLGNLRAGLVVALAIPLSMLFAFSGMLRFGIAGSLLSLGALDFGLIVDGSVITIENVVRHLSRADPGGRSRIEVVRDAAIEVLRPSSFGVLIITIVYLPILTLEGVEGKMFRPMALTVVFALAGSLILSLTLMPVLASLLLPKRISGKEPLPVRVLRFLYGPLLRFALDHRAAVLGGTLAILAAAGIVARGLGSEFVPRLSEGAIVVNVVRLAGTDLEESVRYNTLMERALLKAFPDEIAHAWSRIGTAEVATDPMGVELTDIFVTLRPREGWRRAATQAELVALVQRELRDMPGQRLALTQPIEMRVNEMISGVRSDVAVKLFGDDFEVLAAKAREIEGVLRSVPGCVDSSTEQITGQPVLRVRVDQAQVARYGLSAAEVLRQVEALGGIAAGEVVEGQLRFPLVVRLPEAYRTGPEAVASLLVATASGERLPLSRLAHVELTTGPSTITREWGRRRITIQCNVRGRDVGGFVAEAQGKIATAVRLPAGRYHLEWGGQFENLERARLRLLVIVPLALVLIFGLLCASLGSSRLAILVFSGVPLAVTGGVAALWFRGIPFSISAAVGFIALSGVAVLNGLVMITFIRQLRLRGLGLREAVMEGSLGRLRPVLMTALVASLGFVPMALATGMGAEVQKPLATVVIGGIVSSTLLTLFVLPVLYGWFEPPLREEETGEEPSARTVPAEAKQGPA